MKIQVDKRISELFKKFFTKKEVKQTKVIKVDFNKNTEEKIRTGATMYEENNKNKTTKKQAGKIFVAMVIMLLISTSLNFRVKDYLKIIETKPEDISSMAVSTNIDDTENVLAEKVVTKKVEEKLVFWPALEGEVQKIYSTDKVIYSKTLEQWKTHDGIDISAATDTAVKAIEKGVVKAVYNDPFYGMTIEIEHIQGYKSVYSNLDSNVYVSLGDSVIRGQKIAKVGNTSVGEYLDEPHLHFRLYLHDKNINPTYIFK